MKPRLLTLIYVFAGLILLSQSAYAASYCVEADFARGAASAEVIFTGKLTNVEQVETSTAPAGTYYVTFKVETWWKGRPANELRVLWRSASMFDCPFFPVGEVGEDYLVYGDPSRSSTSVQLPEVTVFNRTSRLPANRQPAGFLIDDWAKQTRISPSPELNRADASDDIKLLVAFRACGCLSTSDSALLPSFLPNFQEAVGAPSCQTCLRGWLKPF